MKKDAINIIKENIIAKWTKQAKINNNNAFIVLYLFEKSKMTLLVLQMIPPPHP